MSIDSKQMPLINSSLGGIARGIFVHTLIYPLEVVKIHQQSLENSEKCSRVARTLYQQGGSKVFYKGLSHQLLKTSLKQSWCWPMITGIPTFLQCYDIEEAHRQMLTGLFIATIDAAVATPLEKAKILSAFNKETKFSFISAYRDGWRGFMTHWAKLSINWSAFLMAQKYLRDRNRTHEEPLSVPQLIKIGTQTALIVSLVAAPFDLANTLKQTQNLSPCRLISAAGMRKWYRGWPLNAISLIVHNVASIILIDKLGA